MSQRRTVTLDFAVEEKVRIVELRTDGIVLCVFLDSSSIQYKVRYFYNGEAKEVYFYAWELLEKK